MDETKLFSDVRFVLTQCNNADEIKNTLIERGARHINYLSEHVTHAIADSDCPEAVEAVELYDKPVVTSQWVYSSLEAKQILPTEAFSPMKRIFQNVIATFSKDLSTADIQTLAATITFYGGRVSKNSTMSTHFIVASSKPNDLTAEYNFKIVAPDWVLDSIKNRACCDESLYDPHLLLSPPPPTPPPPPKEPTPEPIKPQQISSEAIKNNENRVVKTPKIMADSSLDKHQSSILNQNVNLLQSNPQSQQHQHQQDLYQVQHQLRYQQPGPNNQIPSLTISQIPRPRVTQNIMRGVQPRFRPLLPPTTSIQQRHSQKQQTLPIQRVTGPDSQQPKLNINYNPNYRKVSPSQNNLEIKQHVRPITYSQQQVPIHQPNQLINQPTRLPQPNISSHHQVRAVYSNASMQPRGLTMPQQPPTINQQQTPQLINRFQDPNSQHPNRPHQVCVQPQSVNANYAQNNASQQGVYYPQNNMNHQGMYYPQNNMNRQAVYYAQNNVNNQIQTRPMQPTAQIINEPRHANARNVTTNIAPPKPAKAPINPPQQPHPSIFDHKQEPSLAQIKAKVPIVDEKIEYMVHEHEQKVPKDLPLLGCIFKFVEYTDIHSSLMQKWCSVIQMAGGTFRDELKEATHLICETRLSPIYADALRFGIRCITIYWINDVLADNKIHYPWKAIHLPLPFPLSDKPLKDEIISITNFKGKVRREVKEMIVKTGAKFTDYFSQMNTLLICGSAGGDKYERAIEWRTPIANCELLGDFILQSGQTISSMITQAKYQILDRNEPMRITSYASIRDIMKPWLKPIPVPAEPPQSVSPPIESKTEENKIECNAPDENMSDEGANNQSRSVRESTEPVRILFTRIEPKLAAQLRSYANELGLGFADSPIDCTHLVVDRISRTPKFVCAFSHASYILSHNWITESHKLGKVLNEKQFILQDAKGEEEFSFNLVYSLLKRKRRSGLLFSNLIFFVTPSVLSSITNLKEMIESAGGIVITRKPPSKAQVDQMKSEGKRFVVITNPEDLCLCSTMSASNVDIVDVEFVISGILRQDIDFEAHRIKSSTPFNRPERALVRVSALKRLRLD